MLRVSAIWAAITEYHRLDGLNRNLFSHSSVLSPFGLLQQKALDWIICKKQSSISHTYRGWEMQDKSSRRVSGVWQAPVPQVTPSLCPPIVEGANSLIRAQPYS